MVLHSLISSPNHFNSFASGESGVNGGLTSLPFLSSLPTGLLLSSLLSYQPAESIITFISLQSSYNWYMHLSQFETIFLAFLMLQICFFRYLEILPINMNNFYLGDPTGRRRRRKRTLWNNDKFDCDEDVFLISILKVIRRLDVGNCLPRTLCELESISSSSPSNFTSIDKKISENTSNMLHALKKFAKYRHLSEKYQMSESTDVSHTCAALQGLQYYEDAVLIGSSAPNYHNSTICEESYSACPLTKEDIKHYIATLIDANMI